MNSTKHFINSRNMSYISYLSNSIHDHINTLGQNDNTTTTPNRHNSSIYEALLTDSNFMKLSDSLVHMPTVERGLLYNTLVTHPEYLMDPEMRDVVLAMLGVQQTKVSPVDVVNMLKVNVQVMVAASTFDENFFMAQMKLSKL